MWYRLGYVLPHSYISNIQYETVATVIHLHQWHCDTEQKWDKITQYVPALSRPQDARSAEKPILLEVSSPLRNKC